MGVEFFEAVFEGDGRKVIYGSIDLRGEGGGFVRCKILGVDNFTPLLPQPTLPSNFSQKLPRLHYIMEELSHHQLFSILQNQSVCIQQFEKVL